MMVRGDEQLGFLGDRRQGKTTLNRAIIGKLPTVRTWDPTHAYDESQGYRVVGSLEEMVKIQGGRVAYHTPTPGLKDFEAFCGACVQMRGVHVVLDEPWFAIKASTTADKAPNHASLCRLGHKPGLAQGVSHATHRFADLPVYARMMDHYFFFKTTSWADKEAAEVYIGRDRARKLGDLPRFHFFHRDPVGEIRLYSGDWTKKT